MAEFIAEYGMWEADAATVGSFLQRGTVLWCVAAGYFEPQCKATSGPKMSLNTGRKVVVLSVNLVCGLFQD